MQIVKNLRNLFNQYDTEENSLTHSLLHTIASDEKLFRDFIIFAIGKFPFDKKDKISIGSQGRYGGNVISKKAKGDSIPDAVIHDDDGKTCILIESKVTASLTKAQLENHLRHGQKRGLENPILLLITTDREEPKMDIALNGYRIYWKPWWGIYKWMNDFTEKSMVKELRDYMEILESDIINRNETWEGMLTMFNGIPFTAEEVYRYDTAKWCLKALMNELRKNPELKKIYPTADVTKGRPAVKGKEASEVWDHIGDKDHPHLSFVIKPDWTQIQITLPSIAKAEWRILIDNKEMLPDVLSEIHQQLKKKQPGHVKLIIEVLHRHFRHRQDGVIDGVMYFDVDCILDKGEKFDPKVKMFTGWLDALDCVLKGKKNVNLQIAIFARYDYVKDSIVGKPEFVDEAIRALKALKPFYDKITA